MEIVSGNRTGAAYADELLPTPTTTPTSVPLASGSNQTVSVNGISLSFPKVSTAGSVTASVAPASATTTIPGCSAVPLVLQLSSTASFSGTVTIDIPISLLQAEGYSGPFNKLRLYHQGSSGTWTDITTSLTATDIYGATTSFSPFAVGRDTATPVARALKNASCQRKAKVTLRYRVSDPGCASATVSITIFKGHKRRVTITLRAQPTNQALSYRYTCKLAKGSYSWKVQATDAAGNASKASAARKLRVK